VSRRLTVRPLAEQDLLEAQEWYDEQRPGLGGDFRSTIDGLLRRILERPLLYPAVYRNARRAVVRRFLYLLYFFGQRRHGRCAGLSSQQTRLGSLEVQNTLVLSQPPTDG
jgi:hypothetical protein